MSVLEPSISACIEIFTYSSQGTALDFSETKLCIWIEYPLIKKKQQQYALGEQILKNKRMGTSSRSRATTGPIPRQT